MFDLCMELVYDPVPNVRLQMAPMLPSLKQVIRLPEDVELLEVGTTGRDGSRSKWDGMKGAFQCLMPIASPLPLRPSLLQRLNNAISSISTDNDRDVSFTARIANDVIKRMPVRMGVGTQVGERFRRGSVRGWLQTSMSEAGQIAYMPPTQPCRL